jgi:hypothetical protein
MSSILLAKDHEGNKKGEIISVPFQVGKQLIAQGIGCYPAQKVEQKKPPRSPEAESLSKENERLRKALAEQQTTIDELLAAPKPDGPAIDKNKK